MKTEHVRSHAASPAVEAVLDPPSNAYSKSIDPQLHQEPLWHMHDAELTWSILSTDVDYTVADVQGPYKALNNSPLFNLMEPLKLDETEYPDNLDRYEEVTAHLKVSHSFDEVNDIITTYLGVTYPLEREEASLMITIYLLIVEESQLVISWTEQ